MSVEKDVLFVGKGVGAPCYYRCMLPALGLGTDWVGITGSPPAIEWRTGLARDENGEWQSAMPDLFSYKIVVMQQPASYEWAQVIEGMVAQGIVVLYETDDYLHGIRKMEEHQAREFYGREYLRKAEACMRAASGIIGSTQYIVDRYKDFNPNTYLCRNGIDPGRYRLSKPGRDSLNVGWAGSTGHVKTLIPWLREVAKLMQFRDAVNFISIGENFADGMKKPLGPFPVERALAIPWTAIEQYPAAMTMFDLTLAPSGEGEWWRGKSDLRWLEAGALGIPAICHSRNYPEVIDGETGYLAEYPSEVLEKLYLWVNNREQADAIGQAAKAHVLAERTMKTMREQWREVFEGILN